MMIEAVNGPTLYLTKCKAKLYGGASIVYIGVRCYQSQEVRVRASHMTWAVAESPHSI